MDDKGTCISQTFSQTLDALEDQEMKSSSGVLQCTSSNDQISLVSVGNDSVAMVEGKESVIMINPVSSVIESQQTESENISASTKVDIESGNSSCHQTNTFGDAESVNSNYYVLVEGSDGSQVISRVIPSILPDGSEEPQLALNAVLQSDISYIDNNALNEGKDQTNYSSESVTMIIDSNLQVQEPQKIFIEPSLAHINSENISADQLAILEKGPEHDLDGNLPQKSIVVDTSLLSPHYQSVQVSSQKKDDSSGPQIRIVDVSNWDSTSKRLDLISVQSKEIEKQFKEEQRQIDLRLLEQSHREHQERLLHRRSNSDDKDLPQESDESERILKAAGIDDDTPLFSHISAKINPDLLLHVPGCQNFLLTEAAKKTTGVTFSSELDFTFTGEIKDFVSLHEMIKNLLKLLSPTHLVFEKCKGSIRQENKNIGCNLLVPYISSKGRLSRQSSKLMQMGGLLNMEEYLSDMELDDGKSYLKRKKRGYRKRKVHSNDDRTERIIDFASNYGLSDLGKVTSDEKQEECVQPSVKNVNPFDGSASSECAEALNPDLSLSDPLQRRLHDEEIKLKQISDENNTQEEMKTNVTHREKGIHLQCSRKSSIRRSNKGRPPKKFDPSETVVRVKPRNPLTESFETKQRRIYEENVSFKFFCDQCSFKTKRRSQFDHHLAYHEKGTDVKHFCRHCDFISISLPALKQHELLHKKNVLKCTICGVYMTDKKHLMQKHMRLKHSGKILTNMEKTFSCTQCPATFSSRIVLGRHKSLHLRSQGGQTPESVSTNACPQCKKTFGKKMYLHRHMKDVHGPELRPHLCDKCGRSFKRKDALQQHRIVHVAKSARVLPFKCNKCDKAFKSQAHLKEHSTIHSSDRPFLCQYCGASFKTQTVQKKHILTLHIQPRTHVCPVCCRQFNTKHALQRHENTHKAKDATSTNGGMRPWESAVIDNDEMKKIEVKGDSQGISEVSASSIMVSLEEDQASTALVVETDGGAQVMVDPSLVPAMIGSSETHSTSEGTRTLEVSQSLIQTSQTDQAFYYLADDHL